MAHEIVAVVVVGAVALAVGFLCGWFACAHSGELVNLDDKEFTAVVKQICIAHGGDAVMRDKLIDELECYQYDIYQERGMLSRELLLMMDRAGV